MKRHWYLGAGLLALTALFGVRASEAADKPLNQVVPTSPAGRIAATATGETAREAVTKAVITKAAPHRRRQRDQEA